MAAKTRQVGATPIPSCGGWGLGDLALAQEIVEAPDSAAAAAAAASTRVASRMNTYEAKEDNV